MKLIVVFLLVVTAFELQAASFNLRLKDIVKAPQWHSEKRVFSEFEIVKVKAIAQSKTTGWRMKSKGCYANRYENIPRGPFQPKYIYSPKHSSKDLGAEHNSKKTITIYNLKEEVINHAQEFDDRLPRKCKVTKEVSIFVVVKLKSGSHEKYHISLNLTKSGLTYVNPVLPLNPRDVFGYEDLTLKTGSLINLGFSQTTRSF